MEDRILNLPKLPKWWNRKVSILLIVLLSIVLHAWTVWQLPQDYDEPVYLKVASDYAKLIKQNDINGLLNYDENQEHPAFVKLIYCVPYLIFQQQYVSSFYLFFNRSISAIFGILTVFIVALINPWAGFLFSLHSMTLKYTSQVYLEAIPQFFMVLSIFALLKSEKRGKWWFYLSAVSVGLIAASKYPYLLIIFVLGYIWLNFENKRLSDGVKFVLISLLTFLLFNISLWMDPVNKLIASFMFHGLYSQSSHVQSYAYSWYQPLVYISTSVQWHPQVFFFFTSDEFVFYVTIFGLWFEIKERKWTAVWLFLGLLVLLIWPTKWPQYTLIITPVLAIIAGNAITRGWNWIKPRDDYWNYLEAMLPKPPKVTWWIIGIFIVILTVGKVGYEYQLAIARVGWNSFDTSNSPLRSNVVNEIVAGKNDEILLATNNGLEIWQIENENLWGGGVQQFDTTNSPLQSNRITAIQYESNKETYWIGTEEGIASFNGKQWVLFDSQEMGCNLCLVNDIFIDQENLIWTGLNDGIYFYDQKEWTKLIDPERKLANEIVLTIARRNNDKEDQLWVGTINGISIYDFVNNQWTHENWSDNYFGWGGVLDLNILDDNSIIANTSGGGIGIYQTGWTFYKNSNSPFISNIVNTSVQEYKGSLWFGFAYSTEPGGYLMRLDKDNQWHKYFSNTSGYQEGEPLDLFIDNSGRLWVATNGTGIQTFFKEENSGD